MLADFYVILADIQKCPGVPPISVQAIFPVASLFVSGN
jgi:hypothetical protein